MCKFFGGKGGYSEFLVSGCLHCPLLILNTGRDNCHIHYPEMSFLPAKLA